MSFPDRIRVTPLRQKGLNLANIDALMRLRALGYQRKSEGVVFHAPSKRLQLDFLARFSPPIHSVKHYKELIGDERSEGPIHKYETGMTLLMEKAEDKASGRHYYMIIDTGIGAREVFLEELQRNNSIRIESLE